MVTSCELARAVWVVKETVTDLPVARGMRSAAAMVIDTPVIWPPRAGHPQVPTKSVVVETAMPVEAEAAIIPVKVAPVRVKV